MKKNQLGIEVKLLVDKRNGFFMPSRDLSFQVAFHVKPECEKIPFNLDSHIDHLTVISLITLIIHAREHDLEEEVINLFSPELIEKKIRIEYEKFRDNWAGQEK